MIVSTFPNKVKTIEQKLKTLIHMLSLQTGNKAAVTILCVTVMSSIVIENDNRSPDFISIANCRNDKNVKRIVGMIENKI
jgi:hypothetical protein